MNIKELYKLSETFRSVVFWTIFFILCGLALFGFIYASNNYPKIVLLIMKIVAGLIASTILIMWIACKIKDILDDVKHDLKQHTLYTNDNDRLNEKRIERAKSSCEIDLGRVIYNLEQDLYSSQDVGNVDLLPTRDAINSYITKIKVLRDDITKKENMKDE